jgi:hypothetical protein
MTTIGSGIRTRTVPGWVHTGWILLLVFPACALSWSRSLGSPVGLLASDGNAVVTAVGRRGAHDAVFADILKVSSLTGRTAWQHRWRGPASQPDDEVNALVANGDVIAGGTMVEPKELDDFGSDLAAARWTQRLGGPDRTTQRARVSPRHDVWIDRWGGTLLDSRSD